MPETYPYNADFRLKLLSLMLDDAWMAKFGFSIIQPQYFETSAEEDVAKAILDYREKYRTSPRDPADIVALSNIKYQDLVDSIFEPMDLRLAGDVALQWAKQQAVKLAILESVEDIQKGDLQKPVDRLREAVRTGDNVLAPGMDPIKDIDKWLYEFWINKVPTGWIEVDRELEGGLDFAEEGVILAPSNRGKTMGLVCLGYNMASVAAGINVVHVTHELSVAKVCKRYVARMLFRFPHPGDDLEEYKDAALDAARKLLVGNIRVIGGAYKMATTEYEGHLDRLLAEGFEFGAIVDDYLDLVIPPRNYTDRRFELTATYEWYRALGERYKCPVWTATQGRRESLNKEIITIADVAEDIGKVNTADVVIALCQTKEEFDANQCRLFMAKVRDGKKNALISAKFYGDCQSIVTTGYVNSRSKDQNV